jgi:hypothetical protein
MLLQFKKEMQPMAKTTVEIPDERLAELEAYKEKLGQLELLYRLFGAVGLPGAVFHEVVIRGSQRGYSDALLIEIALQRKQLVVLDVICGDLPFRSLCSSLNSAG